MAYTLDWEPLADALKRVMASGATEDELKTDLCRAVADRKIDVRVRIEKSDRARGGQVFSDGNVGVPAHLNPADFDWKQSRPMARWPIGPRDSERDKSFWMRGWEDWPLDLIELFRADVTAVLCGGAVRPAKDNVQLYGGGERERDRRTRQWRAARIKRFTERQRHKREWINFAEIADWCSKEDQSIVPNKEKSAAAFDTLANDLLAGEFTEHGRSRVLYLHPATARARMTREWLHDAMAGNYDGDHGRSAYLAHSWIPRRLFNRWLAKHRLPESPPRFEPIGGQSSARLKKPKRGRPAEYNWRGVKSRLAAYVSQHGPVRSSDELLQKCADFASELHPKSSTPSDKTIREAIKTHALDVAAGVVPGK